MVCLDLSLSLSCLLQKAVVTRIVESKIQAEQERNRLKEEEQLRGAEAVADGGGIVGSAATAGGKATSVAKRKRCGNCVGCRAKPCDRCKYVP